MVCHFCGMENSAHNAACFNCGAELGTAVVPVGPAIAPDWEAKTGIFSIPSFFITIQEVLFSPSHTFRNLNRDSALFKAFLFGIIGSTIGGAFSTLWQGVLRTFNLGPDNAFIARYLGTWADLCVVVFIMPFCVAVALFALSGLLHLCLTITGGATQGFASTFKVLAYAQGATALLSVVPVCGVIAALFWWLYIMITGLKEAHRTSTMRALVAVVLPVALCCACATAAALTLVVSGVGLVKGLLAL
ncbi:MAG: hypothetical protein A2350_04620 [Candidatus Raymondbacteria bacterium RifOxyB12_full_50_8]|uniref:Yip1 domain-containing protein n=1 Tax=Candidatus Raymondbacteria bacterium RIFOXYD12_FULL_49_13 TaxID=1817890 RepID=A0A1F7F6G7_UNCRA|nr:MAG: hypothetical protein A2248_13180 [Candidatus Raymondbacteria bacterium RIFOXYA2_FULL_49_16]OGJ96051.1 MAG: hypothetical protein A2350_04620 [Candidatus Raymondbacteria bacterium RifOxyB12_full_50_8]OGK02239.1 MAG: hypothetical protein A2519_16295 [Candidatus Raymondbacteria bacterium RIFOXYD12_FULL_49_13]OGP45148.1 MAG: hypothetical protein A2324_12175 [Candidatus Raymondbacteria bacterium RIFOXYB2_FULL_49_35]